MSAVSLHVLPKDIKDEAIWEAYATRSKALRLQSLQNDPKSFVSKYESEVKEPMSFWTDRLKDAKAWTVVMTLSVEALPDTSALLREDVEWAGFCVMVDPDVESAAEKQDVQELKQSDWFMAAVWLKPELRGRGAGKRLVQAGIDASRKADLDRGITGKYVMTQVVKGNESRLELYKKVGFHMTGAEPTIEKEGILHHSYELKIAL